MISDHIAICICTYKRPKMLKKLLTTLGSLDTNALFTFSVNVIDNDPLQSAQLTVVDFQRSNNYPVKYLIESQRSITLARNRGIEKAADSMVAFIDDDEFPRSDWLLCLYKTLKEKSVAGVLGPVLPYFENEPPAWVVKSRLCMRSSFPTGHLLHWSHTRTGNVLLSREVMKDTEARFSPQFGTGGGDIDFFKRLINRGHKFVWCNEGIVFEEVPILRQKRLYFCRRALLQGGNSLRYAFSTDKTGEKIALFLKTFLAALFYTALLPVFRIAGDHLFMRYLVKACHHLGRLFAIIGISVIKKRDL